MPNAKDLIVEPNFKILIYSRHGTGKSSFASTFLAAGPMYVFDFDLRLGPYAGLDIDYDSYRDTSWHAPTAFRQAENQLEKLEKENPYRTIVLDSLFPFLEAAMAHGMPLVKQLMPTLSRIQDKVMALPVQADYNTQLHYAKHFLKKLVKLNCHVIVCAHDTNLLNKEGVLIQKNLKAPKQLSEDIPGLFNEYWRMEIQQMPAIGGNVQPDKHWLITKPSALYSARSSRAFEKAFDAREEPDFTKLYAKLQAYIKANYASVLASAQSGQLSGAS